MNMHIFYEYIWKRVYSRLQSVYSNRDDRNAVYSVLSTKAVTCNVVKCNTAIGQYVLVMGKTTNWNTQDII